MDAAHFVFAPFLGYLWCFVRMFIKAPSGRQRFNVLGALNPHARCKTSPGDHFWHNPSVRTLPFRYYQPPQKDEAALDFDFDKCFAFSWVKLLLLCSCFIADCP
jgi:hypothetical protein